jgi:hypothetical protein
VILAQKKNGIDSCWECDIYANALRFRIRAKHKSPDSAYSANRIDDLTVMRIIAVEEASAMIKKVKEGYKVTSEKGKNLGGPYKTREEAAKRLRQVEYFKHNKG